MKTYLKDLTLEEVIKRLKNGEVVKIDNIKSYYKMIDGVICRFYEDGDIGVGDMFYKAPRDIYFETEESFKITKIGYYKARNGKKVFVYDIDGDNIRFVAIGGKRYYTGHIDGSFWNNKTQKPYDIIGKWED